MSHLIVYSSVLASARAPKLIPFNLGLLTVTSPVENEWIDLPVGTVLRDHPMFTIQITPSAGFSVYNYSTINTVNDTPLHNASSGIIYTIYFWTSVETNGTARYMQGTVAPSTANNFNIKIYLTHGLTSSGSLGITADGATDLTSDSWLKTEDDKATITTFVTELFEYLNASEDLSISPANATIESVTQSFTGGSHCVMGETNDNSSVVDTDTRVWDTDNLFVAEASIHPDLPTGNTQSP